MATQLKIDFGVTEQECCMMCHLSSECKGCCKACKDKCSSMQECGQDNLYEQTSRLGTWLYMVRLYKDLNIVAHKVMTPKQIKYYKIPKLRKRL